MPYLARQNSSTPLAFPFPHLPSCIAPAPFPNCYCTLFDSLLTWHLPLCICFALVWLTLPAFTLPCVLPLAFALPDMSLYCLALLPLLPFILPKYTSWFGKRRK